jgi:aspartate/methionine/tyrosine aminotransferase
MTLEQFRMERYQSLHWHEVDHDLSESGVSPMTIRELLGPDADAEAFLRTGLGYPLSEGSEETRANVAAWYPGARTEHVTIVNGGSEANLLSLWALLEPQDRLAFMVPNYMQGWGLGPFLGERSDAFHLRMAEGRWRLDLDELHAAVTERTKAVMVCNPNNPTGHVLNEEEMHEVVRAAERVGAWIVADEIYRGAELGAGAETPTFFGRYDRVIVTSGLSKAFAMPGLRVGWVVAPPEMIERIWERHDYTTLTPSVVGDRLAAVAMRPEMRETILARTRSIVRANYPRLEGWFGQHDDVLTWVPPLAGAIAYAEYDLPVGSLELVERIRRERSVLLVPGEMFGLGDGFRLSFGYDIEHTLEGLSLVGEVLGEVAAGAQPTAGRGSNR